MVPANTSPFADFGSLTALSEPAENQTRQRPYVETANTCWGMLRRTPTEAKATVARIAAGATIPTLIGETFASAAYRNRF